MGAEFGGRGSTQSIPWQKQTKKQKLKAVLCFSVEWIQHRLSAPVVTVTDFSPDH